MKKHSHYLITPIAAAIPTYLYACFVMNSFNMTEAMTREEREGLVAMWVIIDLPAEGIIAISKIK